MTTSNKDISVLILDDDVSITQALKQYLSVVCNYRVSAFGHPAEAIKSVKQMVPDLLICDLHLPEINGIQFLKMVKELPGHQPEIIVITGYGEKKDAIECLRLGAIDFLEKPFPLEILKASIDRAVQFIANSKKINQKLLENKLSTPYFKQQNIELLGNSKEMQTIRELIIKIGKTNDTSVLITGETGTGKEVIARQIHMSGYRSVRPFYAKNCATVPEQLFESEFFGHMKGAYTGAVTDHKGWFETANGSTLFLDEISALPLSMQPKLLRVLEEKSLNRVGSSANINLNLRVIAASNMDLQELCAENKFRMDLYYRLNVFSLHIPPLRQRKEDIPVLFDHFITQSAQKNQKEGFKIHKKVYELLGEYSFPGNVRELKNMAERLVILADTQKLSPEILNTILFSNNQPVSGKPISASSLAQQEADLIFAALKQSDNVIARAARLLKITDQSLLRRIKKYGISPPV